jgi:hypothetical protein
MRYGLLGLCILFAADFGMDLRAMLSHPDVFTVGWQAMTLAGAVLFGAIAVSQTWEKS